MSITVNRNTGWIGMGSAISLYLNGTKVDKVKHNQLRHLPVPEEGATLHVSQFGVKSKAMRVYRGDFIEIETTRWGNFLIIAIILFPLIPPLLNETLGFVLLIVYIIAVIYLYFFVEGFHFTLAKTSS